MTYFLDFDNTLFNSPGFKKHLSEKLGFDSFEGHIGEIVERAENGSLSFDAGELESFIYPDVSDFFRTAGSKAAILTFGNPVFQKLKIDNALAGIAPLSVIYTGDTHKGEYMKERIASYAAPSVFADDRPMELGNMAEHCPQVRLFEMRRDGGAGDGRWPVIHSLAELP